MLKIEESSLELQVKRYLELDRTGVAEATPVVKIALCTPKSDPLNEIVNYTLKDK